MRTPKPTPLNARAIRYIAGSIAGNPQPSADKLSDWILGHLVAFAAAEVRRYKKALRRRLDEATVGIHRSGADSLKKSDRAPFKGGALWAIWAIRKDMDKVQLVAPKRPRKERA